MSKAKFIPLLVLVLLSSRTAGAVDTLVTAAAVAERAYAELAVYLAEARKAEFSHRKANEIRAKIREQTRKFTRAMTALDLELAALKHNPEENKQQIAELEKAKRQSEQAREHLKKLNSLMAQGDETMLNALRSGFMKRTAEKVAEAMGEATQTLKSAHEELAPPTDGFAGFVEVQKIDVDNGDLAFYMKDFVAGKGVVDVRLKPGGRYNVRSLPIRIRASIQDDQKKKLTKLEEQQVVGTIEFLPTQGYTVGHRFKYRGRPGTTTWTALEKYTWTAEPHLGTKEKVRRLLQRNSDASTRPETGDVVEITPTGRTAQNLEFEVTAAMVWFRETSFGTEDKKKVVPENNNARAVLVFSYFPHN